MPDEISLEKKLEGHLRSIFEQVRAKEYHKAIEKIELAEQDAARISNEESRFEVLTYLQHLKESSKEFRLGLIEGMTEEDFISTIRKYPVPRQMMGLEYTKEEPPKILVTERTKKYKGVIETCQKETRKLVDQIQLVDKIHDLEEKNEILKRKAEIRTKGITRKLRELEVFRTKEREEAKKRWLRKTKAGLRKIGLAATGALICGLAGFGIYSFSTRVPKTEYETLATELSEEKQSHQGTSQLLETKVIETKDLKRVRDKGLELITHLTTKLKDTIDKYEKTREDKQRLTKELDQEREDYLHTLQELKRLEVEYVTTLLIGIEQSELIDGYKESAQEILSNFEDLSEAVRKVTEK